MTVRRAFFCSSAFFAIYNLGYFSVLHKIMNYWLVKQEPEAYSWDNFVRDEGTNWDGVRNYQARNNLRAMKRGDRLLFYHSVGPREIVGIARVHRTAFPDPTATEGDWSAVHLKPVKRLKNPISLDRIKKEPSLSAIALIKNSRLSVQPLPKSAFDKIVKMGL
jgi:predicted RNA-binding protein with PUA-like domain